MKAKEVMRLLEISRPTLSRYVKQGLVKVDSIINGKYRYNKESVEKLLCNNIENNDNK
jgi:predicted site-specific integrase-resolvase